MTEHDFAAEVERLLWDFHDPDPDLGENLDRIKSLLEDYDASTRAHLSLAEAVLASVVWANHHDLSQNLLWALCTLHDQDHLWLGMERPVRVPTKRAAFQNRQKSGVTLQNNGSGEVMSPEGDSGAGAGDGPD